jgi:fused signal recognition particle receptor
VADLVTKRKLDRAMLDDIEDVLLRADLGAEVAARVAASVGVGRYDKSISADEVKSVVAAEVEKVLAPVAKSLVIDETRKPFVILVVGVNLRHHDHRQGRRKVLGRGPQGDAGGRGYFSRSRH